ncbi:hypothetical protein QJS10_CPB13g00407 [Acorus calamus]|uniref:N-acetyltransferase domain-containing protein n=1 Tax=Acorus calamus TaxID=4465 RepID=A0AAV9DGX2_ACOCL|nr:hypothetical protein QJS10_CPB13g00407 [Acorus calamus]
MGGCRKDAMVAALPPPSMAVIVVVREYEETEKERTAVVALERRCEVGSSGKASLFTDQLGDPVSRVRNSPSFLVLVAEVKDEIVGVIRGCIKTVTTRNGCLAKLAYVLGLRVSPSHRRMGIGLNLVRRMEEWFRSNGAEYSYMATDKDNEASVRLFTGDRLGYAKFRTPSILVYPVFAHRLRLRRRIAVLQIPRSDAEVLYRRRLSSVEFFPNDIDAVLNNPLSLGTFVAFRRRREIETVEGFLTDPPESWAVMSVWNCKEVFKLELRGVSALKRGFARATRAVDRACPWLRIPSVPDMFRPFGFYFLYGLGGEGPDAKGLLRALCAHAHNMAREGGCGVVATEVAGLDPLRSGVPHWKMLSCAEDLWCIKRLGKENSVDDGGDDDDGDDWTRSVPGPSVFVDPREV